MSMSEGLFLGLSFLAGCGLGMIYFLGLWWTVRRISRAKNPHLLVLLSFLGRLTIAVAGFYAIMGSDWKRLLVALAGFLIVRHGCVRRFGPEDTTKSPLEALQGDSS